MPHDADSMVPRIPTGLAAPTRSDPRRRPRQRPHPRAGATQPEGSRRRRRGRRGTGGYPATFLTSGPPSSSNTMKSCTSGSRRSGENKPLGRPHSAIDAVALANLPSGLSLRQRADALGVSRSTLSRAERSRGPVPKSPRRRGVISRYGTNGTRTISSPGPKGNDFGQGGSMTTTTPTPVDLCTPNKPCPEHGCDVECECPLRLSTTGVVLGSLGIVADV